MGFAVMRIFPGVRWDEGTAWCREKVWPVVYEEEAVIWDAEENPIQVRLITVVQKAPTRDGEQEIAMRTNLAPRQVCAAKVAAIYASRWGWKGPFRS